ncbi:MAG: MBL fold metallo-hydrolase [Alphaproteobacteria bacterium]
MPTQVPFVRAIDIDYGRVDQVSPMIRRVTANNPSPFTYKGTGTYIVGRGEVAVIDPGPIDETHLAALERTLHGERIAHILITHTHNDHSPLARAVQAKLGGRTFGYGPHGSGKAEEGVVAEEGGDMAFVPDVRVSDGTVISGEGYTFECVFTPGHTSNHMCYALREERALFSGDHVMGWSTTVIVPPDGDMASYMASLRKLLARDDAIFWPTHGPPITDPKPFLRALIAHREEREAQVIECLKAGLTRIPEMVARIYADTDKRLWPAASLSVLAHLQKLIAEGRAHSDSPPSSDANFSLVPSPLVGEG